MKIRATALLIFPLLLIIGSSLCASTAMSLTAHTPPPVPTLHPGDTSSSIPATGYAFEKSVEIIGSPDGALSDYQVMFTVHRGNGTDSGHDTYLNGNSQSWPNDIRFAGTDGKDHPYWIESYDANTAIIWVKVDHIPASPALTNISIVFGKAHDISASDGSSTFPYFDDFSGASLDTATRWKSQPMSASVKNGMLTVIGDNDGNVLSTGAFGPGYALETRISMTSMVESDNFIGFGNTTPLTTSYAGAFNTWRSGDWMYDGNYFPGNTGIRLSTDWYRLTSMRSPNGTSVGMIDLAGHYTGKVDLQPYPICIHHYGNGATNVDWILVRKYTQDEPAIGDWNGETAILLPQAPQALSGYSCFKANTVQGSSDGALADYQVKYIVHRGNGTDSGPEVYLNNGSLSWPDDIRFTNAYSQYLPYWIESFDGATATVWVKADKIPAYPDTCKIYIAYGKANDTGATDIDDTMAFGDDFAAQNSWTTYNYDTRGSAKIQDGMLDITSGNDGHPSTEGVKYPNSHASDHTAWGVGMRADGGEAHFYVLNYNPMRDPWHDPYWYRVNAFQGSVNFERNIIGTPEMNFTDYEADNSLEHAYEIRFDGKSVSYAMDGRQYHEELSPLSGSLYLAMENTRADMPGTTFVDYVYVRNYTRNEPLPGRWNVEKPHASQYPIITTEPIATPSPTTPGMLSQLHLSSVDVVLLLVSMLLTMVLIGVLVLFIVWTLIKH